MYNFFIEFFIKVVFILTLEFHYTIKLSLEKEEMTWVSPLSDAICQILEKVRESIFVVN